MPSIHIDHISMCVNDLDKAIDDWSDILKVLAPGHVPNLSRGGGDGDGVPMDWATFQNPDPTGVSIQLWTPAIPDTWVHKVLAKRGEFVHHIAFLSDNFGHTIQECRDAGLPIMFEENTHPDTMPWLAWNFIGMEKAHGVLIELATRYQAVGDRWYPHPGNAENKHMLDALKSEYYGG